MVENSQYNTNVVSRMGIPGARRESTDANTYYELGWPVLKSGISNRDRYSCLV